MVASSLPESFQLLKKTCRPSPVGPLSPPSHPRLHLYILCFAEKVTEYSEIGADVDISNVATGPSVFGLRPKECCRGSGCERDPQQLPNQVNGAVRPYETERFLVYFVASVSVNVNACRDIAVFIHCSSKVRPPKMCLVHPVQFLRGKSGFCTFEVLNLDKVSLEHRLLFDTSITVQEEGSDQWDLISGWCFFSFPSVAGWRNVLPVTTSTYSCLGGSPTSFSFFVHSILQSYHVLALPNTFPWHSE